MRKDSFIASERNSLIPVSIFSAGRKGPLVLLAHSFKSDRSEDGRYDEIGGKLSENGINVISCDFAGCGQSEERLTELTIENCLADLEACYRYMLETCDIDPSRLGIVGYSLGGRIASLFVAEHPEFHNIVFWASCNERYSLNDRFLQQDLKSLMAQGTYCQFTDVFTGSLDVMSTRFFRELIEYDALRALEHFRGNALIIQGERDVTIDKNNALWIYDALKECENIRLVRMEKADHGFGIFDGRKQDSEKAVKLTADFLITNFV